MVKKENDLLTPIQKKVFRQLMWDYNYPPEDVLKFFKGNIERLGHYTKESLFRKLIENFPWFTVVRLFPTETIFNLLTDELIQKLRHKSLKRDYEFAKKRLQEII